MQKLLHAVPICFINKYNSHNLKKKKKKRGKEKLDSRNNLFIATLISAIKTHF